MRKQLFVNRILLLAFFLIGIIICNAQNDDEVRSGHYKTSTALSVGPIFLIGIQEEFYADSKKVSFILSFDYRRRENNSNDYYGHYQGSRWSNNLFLRPGIRFYYNRKNNGFFNCVSILVASEKNKLSDDSIFGYGGGASVGYRYIFRNQIFIETEGFLGAVRGRFTYDDPYPTSIETRYYAIADFRLGYRF